MLHVVQLPDRSIADAVEELRDRIAEAYTQVNAARQALAALPPLADLPTHLQTAEAELVRASVALGKIDLGVFRGASTPRPPATPVIPFDVERRNGYEYGS
jgi:hypothetical protein